MSHIDTIFNAISDFWQLMISLARNFTIKDAIDVAIVTFLIYGCIKLLRETRAGQLVKGVILFILIFLIANTIELQMLSSILTYFFQFAFVAILIVFQPEIRKALEQMGRNNVGKSIVNAVGSKDKETEIVNTRRSVNSIVEAISLLQKLKMGALIIFERKTKLGDIVDTGTPINAEISAQLVANIFYNKAPLHDGAMMIRHNKILAAGCILPLTKNDSLSSALGTRHRAALGMSEESDAVVVVVSEETGQISTAVNGILRRDYSRDTLRDALTSYLIDSDDKGEKKNHLSGKFSLFYKKRGN